MTNANKAACAEQDMDGRPAFLEIDEATRAHIRESMDIVEREEH